MSAVGASTSGTLKVVETTTWLATRTPHTTRIGHDNVRGERVAKGRLGEAYKIGRTIRKLISAWTHLLHYNQQKVDSEVVN